MSKKKPDAFTHMVQKEYRKWLNGPQESGWLTIGEKLLRRYHARVVRMVKRSGKSGERMFVSESQSATYRLACDDILDKLNAMAKR